MTGAYLPVLIRRASFILRMLTYAIVQCRQLSTLVCPQPPYTIGDWLSELGTHGVICSGIHQHHQLQLQQLGIWLIWGVSGEIESVLEDWLNSEKLHPGISEFPENTIVCHAQ